MFSVLPDLDHTTSKKSHLSAMPQTHRPHRTVIETITSIQITITSIIQTDIMYLFVLEIWTTKMTDGDAAIQIQMRHLQDIHPYHHLATAVSRTLPTVHMDHTRRWAVITIGSSGVLMREKCILLDLDMIMRGMTIDVQSVDFLRKGSAVKEKVVDLDTSISNLPLLLITDHLMAI